MVIDSVQALYGPHLTSRVVIQNQLSNEVLYEIYRLRKQAFIDRRHWDIPSYDGSEFEIDEFDDTKSFYSCIYYNRCLTGCVRLRPSVLPNMLEGSLGTLFSEVDYNRYSSSNLWEASRFTISKSPKKINSGIDIRTAALFLSMIDFSLSTGINHYIVVIDKLMLVILKRAGWDCEIIGSGAGSKGEEIYLGLLSSNLDVKSHIFDIHREYCVKCI